MTDGGGKNTGREFEGRGGTGENTNARGVGRPSHSQHYRVYQSREGEEQLIREDPPSRRSYRKRSKTDLRPRQQQKIGHLAHCASD